MHKAMDSVSQACDTMISKLARKNTKVVYLPASGKPKNVPTITLNKQRLQVLINSPILEALCQ